MWVMQRKEGKLVFNILSTGLSTGTLKTFFNLMGVMNFFVAVSWCFWN